MPQLPDEAALAVARVYRGYLALGNETREGPACRSVRCDTAPVIYDANHLQAVSASTPEELDTVLAFQEEVLGDRAHRHVLTDPATPPAVTAGLALQDYTATPTLQLLLDGPLLGSAPRPVDIDAVASEDDWLAVHRLTRADHLEQDEKKGTSNYSERTTDQMLETKRRKAPHVQFFLARVDAVPVAFFSSWPGIDGVGMVEDLFTLQPHRRQGIARALIHHCVADARARGADRVLIGADTDDTPKHAYAAMGFRPTCLTWNWLRKIAA